MYIKNIKSLYFFHIFIEDSRMLTYTNADRAGLVFCSRLVIFYQFDIGGHKC